EVGEDLGLEEHVTSETGQAKGPAVAVASLVVAAEVVLGVADAVPDSRLALPVPRLLQGRQCLAAELEGLIKFAEVRVMPADAVDGVGLPDGVPGLPVEVEGGARVADGIVVLVQLVIDGTELHNGH